MIQTTTPSVDGRTIQEYLGVVTGEAILGANIFKDLFAGVRDIVGGRSGAYEEELRKAREIAMQELAAEATARGADAVVGIDLDYETVGNGIDAHGHRLGDRGPPRRRDLAWREVGDRVWVRRYESLDQTIGVIGGDAGLVVIDTRASHRLADELRADLAQLPGALAAVVNTHGHWDHAFGNARFLPAPIWGHVRCADDDRRARRGDARTAHRALVPGRAASSARSS